MQKSSKENDEAQQTRSTRSRLSRNKKNRKNKTKQRNSKKYKSIILLAEKDKTIEVLQSSIRTLQNKLPKSSTINSNLKTTLCPTSRIGNRVVVATNGHHSGITKSRQMVLASLSGIPLFNNSNASWIHQSCTNNFGSGQFGEVKLLNLKDLGVVAAAKICNSNASKKAIDVETVIGMTVSGHRNFPFVYGQFENRTIVMQFFGELVGKTWIVSPTLAKVVAQRIPANDFRKLCVGIVEGFIFLHSKSILHNDIKADNIVIFKKSPKIIDFGKANLASAPIKYNIQQGSPEHETYEKFHRHLAYELRNIPGSSQSFNTDIFSIGRMFKHAGVLTNPPCNQVIDLGRLMKNPEPVKRISLHDALNTLHEF